VKGKGVVQNEKTVASLDSVTSFILEVGGDALQTAARVPASAVLVNPMRDDNKQLEAAERIVKRALKLNGANKSRVGLCVPASFGALEKESLLKSIEAVGAKPYIVNKAVAAAIGAGKDITAPDEGGIVINVGASATEIAVIAGARVVMTETLEIAGDSFTDAVSRYVVRRRRIEPDEETAEFIKRDIGAVWARDDNEPRYYNGLRMNDGLPKNFKMRPSVLTQAFEEPLGDLLDGICDVIDRIPDDAYDFAAERGILLTGGGCQLWGLAQMIGQVTGLAVTIAEEPETVAAAGACKALAYGTVSEGGILMETEDFI
nr:rod shape-determining protein [Clostridia bacterium]